MLCKKPTKSVSSTVQIVLQEVLGRNTSQILYWRALFFFISPPFINMKHVCNCFLSFVLWFCLEKTIRIQYPYFLLA